MSEVGLHKLEVDTPFLWVDLDILEANIALMVEYTRQAGVNWRPHFKGNKTPAIAHMLLRAGAMGLTCAKVGEAEVLAAAGVQDMLIANQVVGAQKYTRLANLCRTADVKVAVDSTEITARDTACCGSAFLIIDGSVTQGPSALGLQQYNTTFNGTTLRIFN